MDLLTFLNQPEQQGTFPAELSPRGGYITFRNSGRRGDYKYFQLGLDSFITTLSDIKSNLGSFTRLQDYEETSWRNAGSNYTDPPTNAMSAVQTKPLFSTLSKIIKWANPDLYTGIDPERRIVLTNESLSNTITKLTEVAESYKPRVLETSSLEDKNIIIYGAPGTGKSTRVKQIIKGHDYTRTIFHPDTDYASFTGTYKPTRNENGELTYTYVPQAFTRAYVKAWKNLEKPHYLVIEEINRGNCAQIFGDIFQLLDRCLDGFSEYPIDADTDLLEYLKNELSETSDYISEIKRLTGFDDYSKIILPPNLYILATMNTSDQSLFPMDSAFKRRWSWEYIPINYSDAESMIVEIGDKQYNWSYFLRKINPKIKVLTGSEDKQLGNRFVNPFNSKISFKEFRAKILFYLWFEIYKDEAGTPDTIFRTAEETEVSFGDLFSGDENKDIELVKSIMKYNEIEISSILPIPES